jgi:hypothetical protein
VYTVVNKCSLLTVTLIEQRTIKGGGYGVDFTGTRGLDGTRVSSGLGLTSTNSAGGGGGGFFRIPLTGATALGTALAGGFFEAGAFLGCSGIFLDAGGRLSRGGSVFAAA